MRHSTNRRTREELLKRVEAAYRPNPHAGWGLTRTSPRSITNTGEALLTFEALDALNEPFITNHREEMIAHLEVELHEEHLSRLRVRELAFGAVSLRLLTAQRTPTESRAAVVLDAMGAKSGGWGDRGPEEGPPWFIPTYQAISALKYLGCHVEQVHFEWLTRLRAPDGRVCIHPNGEANDAVTLLAFELFARYRPTDVGDLTATAREILRRKLLAIADGTEVAGDVLPLQNWTVYAYGRGLQAFGHIDEPLLRFPLAAFVRAYSLPPDDKSSVPEVLEFAYALRAIRDHVDYQQLFDQELMSTDAAIVAQRAALVEEKRSLTLRQSVLDVMERDLDRERAALTDMETSIGGVLGAIRAESGQRALSGIDMLARLLTMALVGIALLPLWLTPGEFRVMKIIWACVISLGAIYVWRSRGSRRNADQ
jgi:hypothetical protein